MKMILAARLLLAAAVFLMMSGTGHAQSSTPAWQTAAGGKMAFDVASVRQNMSDGQLSYSNFSLDSGNVYSTVSKDGALGPKGGYFSARNTTLLFYILFAYKLSGTQDLALRVELGGPLSGLGLFGGLSANVPTWVKDDRFDIEARAEGTPTKDQMRLMMQSLLAERFKLAVHMETRQVPVFALVLADPAKSGPNLQPHPASDSCDATPLNAAGAAPNSTLLSAVCGVIAHIPPSAPGRYKFGGRNVTLALLANSLPTQTGMATISRPVMDQTGLSGGFDFSLEWTPEPTNPDSPADESGAAFRKALKEQLGLKLISQKGPIDILVIDHVEHPSAN